MSLFEQSCLCSSILRYISIFKAIGPLVLHQRSFKSSFPYKAMVAILGYGPDCFKKISILRVQVLGPGFQSVVSFTSSLKVNSFRVLQFYVQIHL